MNDRILQNAFRVDDEQTAEGDVRFVNQNVVLARELTADIRCDRILHTLDTILFLRGFQPRTMRMYRIGRHAEHLGADAVKLIKAVRKVDQFRRTDKRKVERVKEKNEPFALIVGKLDVL